MSDTIFVKARRNDDRVALWERHPAHPEGEVYIAGEDVVEVAPTQRVNSAITRGLLLEVEAPKKTVAKKESTATAPTAESDAAESDAAGDDAAAKKKGGSKK